MQYQHPVDKGWIDMRHGSTNPDVIELVVVKHGNEWRGSQNLTELRKLCKVPDSHRRRILLILDPFGNPVAEEDMRRSYERQIAGRGNFERHTVTVLYVHPELDYKFTWTP